jgi:hypothetical protein
LFLGKRRISRTGETATRPPFSACVPFTTLTMPANAGLCAGHLHLDVHLEPQAVDLIAKTNAASAGVSAKWAAAANGFPHIGLDSVRLDDKGAETSEIFSLQGAHESSTAKRKAAGHLDGAIIARSGCRGSPVGMSTGDTCQSPVTSASSR